MNDRLTDNSAGFEQSRQARETANEIIIAAIITVMAGLVLVANLLTWFVNVAPYRAPHSVIVLVSTMAVTHAWLFWWLRRGQEYRPIRKYAISAGQALFFAASFPLRAGANRELDAYLSVFPLALFLVLVILSGLRYSRNAVIFTGVFTLLLYMVLIVPFAPVRYQIMTVFTSILLLGAGTTATAYAVSSLNVMHREAMMKERLTRFLAPELVEEVYKHPDILDGQVVRQVATVIFTDVRGFTALSERLSPEEVVRFLNLFLTEMTAAILGNGGMLDKYIGDAVMGVFGAPVSRGDDASRALAAAKEMSDRLKGLNEKMELWKLPRLAVGIGLHTGELVSGAIGSPSRLDYTVIGDTVNVAARLGSLTRSYPVEILLSDTTRQAIGGDLSLHEVGAVAVRGRENPVTVWSTNSPF